MYWFQGQSYDASVVFSIIPAPPCSPLFPYTTLFRSRATQALRQAGSTWKPFVYADAIRNGRPPSYITDDSPLAVRSEEHTSELQSQSNILCRLLLEKKRT